MLMSRSDTLTSFVRYQRMQVVDAHHNYSNMAGWPGCPAAGSHHTHLPAHAQSRQARQNSKPHINK